VEGCALRSPATVNNVEMVPIHTKLFALEDERKVNVFSCLSAHFAGRHFYVLKRTPLFLEASS
jgi:hypothetical protein